MNPNNQSSVPPTTPATGPASYQPGSGTLPTPAGYSPSPAPVQAAVPAGSSPTTPSYGADYLDTIAAPMPTKAPNKFAVIALIGGVLLAALFALLLLNGSQGPSVGSQATTINARISTLQTVANAQQKHLSENAIAEANATLNSSLTTMTTDLSKLVSGTKPDKTASAKESSYQSKLSSTLESAYQRGTLDRTYTVQMTYELTVLRGMLVKLKNNSTKDTIKTFCTTSIANLDIILKLYANFDATKS